MAHEVQCRLCKKYFDAEKEPFTLVGKLSYYHQSCYDSWVKSRNDANSTMEASFWYETVVDYLYRDIKMSIDFQKLRSQWKNFTKPEKKMTPKGIYFTLRYYYEVLNGDKDKALGGIGIVTNVYKDAVRYWEDLEWRKRGTVEAIVNQIKERREREVVTITRKTNKKDKSKFSLDDV